MYKFEGQLCPAEREILIRSTQSIQRPTILEIGTYKGGGSTITFLEQLVKKDAGMLYGIEADRSHFVEMQENIRSANSTFLEFFRPVHGFSQQIIPQVLAEAPCLDIVFLDGGNNPREQIEEFHLVKDAIPIGGYLLSHDANLRKGRWLVPYITELDNWDTSVHQVSEEGLLQARKLASSPSTESLHRAAKKLRYLKLSPVELTATMFPSSLKLSVLRLLPRKLTRWLAEGRPLPPSV